MSDGPTTDESNEDEESTCGKPCHPDAACDECAEYWQRMISEGFWDDERKRWTDRGWASITRTF